MPSSKTIGIFCKKNQTFYYLEYGTNAEPANPVERILRVLIGRNLVVYDTPDYSETADKQYRVLGYQEAKLTDLKIEPIFISKHVEKQVKDHKHTEQVPDGWGMRDDT